MRKILALLVLIVAFSAGFFGVSLHAMANEPQSAPLYQYYKSITIEEGDSLWSLAAEYNEPSQMTTLEYIDQLKSMNGLSSDTIYTGQHFNILYFSPESF